MNATDLRVFRALARVGIVAGLAVIVTGVLWRPLVVLPGIAITLSCVAQVTYFTRRLHALAEDRRRWDALIAAERRT